MFHFTFRQMPETISLPELADDKPWFEVILTNPETDEKRTTEHRDLYKTDAENKTDELNANLEKSLYE